MRLALATASTVVFAMAASAQQRVSFPTQDGGVVSADVYGTGNRGVVLAHGGQFNKESWTKQGRALANAGFRVVAIDFRGYGQSHGPGQSDIYTAPLRLDVLAAIRYLTANGRELSRWSARVWEAGHWGGLCLRLGPSK